MVTAMLANLRTHLLAWAGAAVLSGVAVAVQAACYPMAGITPGFVPVSFGGLAAVPSYHVRISFLGHASFEIESPAGARIVTDYNGYLSARRLPHIVTMNTQSQSHSTEIVEKAIKHVLRGWNPAGGIAKHNLRFKDVRVRNVPTNLQDGCGSGVANVSY